jgi:hypothetical protein
MRNSMMILKSTAAILFLSMASATGCKQNSHSVLLPKTEANAASSLCSRAAPGKIDDGWMPAKSEIDALEAHISRLPVSNVGSYYRQYVGVIISGRRLVYINAMCAKPDSSSSSWRSRLQNACDGGRCFWGAIYDPATGQFSGLAFNGSI